LHNLLVVQCHLVSAWAGAVLRFDPAGRVEVLAAYPPLPKDSPAPVWLAQAVESGRELEHTDSAAIEAGREKLELTGSLLSMYQMRLLLQQRELNLHRLQLAMTVLAAVNMQEKFAGSAMALCNEVAAQWQADRVSLGLHKGRYIHLQAMSHTEKFSRKMQLVQDIESAMEECLDQDIEILTPAVTIERTQDKPFSDDEVEALRLLSDLTTARLINLYERDRWFGARFAAWAKRGLAAVIGPKHTWLKLAVGGVLLAIILLTTLKGDYQADAPFVLQAATRQIISAPYDGFLASVSVQPGSKVQANQTLLGTLDDTELILQLASAQAERMALKKEASTKQRDGKTGEAQVALARAAKKSAEIDLLKYRLNQARIVSPISGTVVAGDLERQIGMPVKTGDRLFDVAPLETLRAELYVPEDSIAEVQAGQRGQLATTSYPNIHLDFTVEHVFPVAEVKDKRNVYRVRVKLGARPGWMKPGMEGVAKVRIGKRPYAWLWTRKMVNWIRMKFWI